MVLHNLKSGWSKYRDGWLKSRLGVLETWVLVSRLETCFYKSWSRSWSWSWNPWVSVLDLVLKP